METKWGMCLVWVVLAWMVAGGVRAQQVSRCVDAQGQVSYQSGACPVGLPDKTWEHGRFAPPSAADAARLRALEREAQRRPSVRQVGALRPERVRTAVDSSIGRCEAAKKRRDDAVYRLGSRRTIAALRALDAEVFQACR